MSGKNIGMIKGLRTGRMCEQSSDINELYTINFLNGHSKMRERISGYNDI